MIRLFVKIGLLIASVCLVASCSEDEGSVGDGLLGTTKVKVMSVEDKDLLITNAADVTTDLSGVSTGLLGTLNDEVFGKTQSGFAFQLRLPGSVSLNKPVIDSVKLFLAYESHYGADSLLMQNANAYLLKDDLQYTKLYNASTDIATLLGEQVGTALFNKKLAKDTIFLKSKLDETKDSVINSKKQVDTILNHLVIVLDNDKVGQYILDGTENDFASTADFIKFFKGLYVNTEDLSVDQGALYGFNMYNSYMRLYIKNTREIENAEDTLYRTSFSLPITDNSARFNAPKFAQPEEILSATNFVYLQGIHGTKATIKMPRLNGWKDSTQVSINKAALVFKAKTSSEEAKRYPLPYRLELVAVNTKGEKRYLRYSNYAGNVPNGLLNVTDSTYTFHIPEYLQDIVDGETDFDHFELATGSIEQRYTNQGTSNYPGDAKNSASRVILYNIGEHKPKLKVTYTRY